MPASQFTASTRITDALVHAARPLAALFIDLGDSEKHLGGLARDSRIVLVGRGASCDQWAALSYRVSGTIVAAGADPLESLSYARTAGVQGTIAVAARAISSAVSSELRAAGADCSVSLPATPETMDILVSQLAARPAVAFFDTQLRVLVDPVSHTILCGDRIVKLSDKEFELLYWLCSANGRPMSATALLKVVWHEKRVGNRQLPLLEFYVSQLRRRLGRIGLRDRVVTVRDFGYALRGPQD